MNRPGDASESQAEHAVEPPFSKSSTAAGAPVRTRGGGNATTGAGAIVPRSVEARVVREQETGGEPLPPSTREDLESNLGTRLEGVRVHNDDGAARLADTVHARAFTLGKDVFFGRGEFRPDTASGRRLLTHEVAHTTGGAPDQLHRKAKPDAGDKPATGDLESERLKKNRELRRTMRGERLVREGDRGEHVRLIQESLIAQGFAIPRRGSDGIFGPETKATVERYQEIVGAKADGIVGPETLGELDRRDPTHPGTPIFEKPTEENRAPSMMGPDQGAATPASQSEGGCAARFAKVTFQLAGAASGVSNAMTPTLDQTDLNMKGTASVAFDPTITISAPNDKTAKEYQVGFAQNILNLERRAHYSNGATLEAQAPSMPLRDAANQGGGTGSSGPTQRPASDAVFIDGSLTNDKPGTLERFKSKSDARTLHYLDTPGDKFPLRACPTPIGKLLKTGDLKRAVMGDLFRTWVLVRHVKTGCIHPLAHFDWQLDWAVRIKGKGAQARIANQHGDTHVVAQGDGSPPFVQGGLTVLESVDKLCTR